ncbi:hypothetical protein [Altererythrobacter sp. GH1-8]|uniref:hypothetical protein n=1 Tax=Altererythrobacter sp. GH1-8 TaxID=3349333 RepID=UPI00374D30C8
MAKDKIKGPLGPIMLTLLVGVAIFMVFVTQSPDLALQFRRPESFYDNMFGKVGIALLFAVVVSGIVAFVRSLLK